MKKTKLLTPLFGLATVAAVAVPLMSCQKPTLVGIKMTSDDEGDYYSEEFQGKKDTEYTFTATLVADPAGHFIHAKDGYFGFYGTPYWTQFTIEKFVIGNVILEKADTSGDNKFWYDSSDEYFHYKLKNSPSVGDAVQVVIKMTEDMEKSYEADFGYYQSGHFSMTWDDDVVQPYVDPETKGAVASDYFTFDKNDTCIFVCDATAEHPINKFGISTMDNPKTTFSIAKAKFFKLDGTEMSGWSVDSENKLWTHNSAITESFIIEVTNASTIVNEAMTVAWQVK